MLWTISNHKSKCNVLNKKIFKRGCSVQYVLLFSESLYDCKEHYLDCISCPETLTRYQLSLETSDGHFLTSIQLTRNCHFFSQTIHTCRSHLLFGNSFYQVFHPRFSPFVDPLSNSDRPSLFCPLKPRKTTKTI